MPKTSHGMQVLEFESIEGWSELDAKIRSSVETHTASAKKQLSIIRDSRLGWGKIYLKSGNYSCPIKCGYRSSV